LLRNFNVLISILLCVWRVDIAAGQTDRGSLIKAGAFPYFNRHGYSAFSAHLELEKAFRRSPFLTSGPRVDYFKGKNTNSYFFIGYDLKLYPFLRRDGKLYQGPFIGINVGYFPRNRDDNYSRHGPGLGPILGYQHTLTDKLTIAAEASMSYLRDLNEINRQYNTERIYIYLFVSVKVGLRLTRASNL
jgi:hypothetical protein